MNVVQSTPFEIAEQLVRRHIPIHLRLSVNVETLTEDIRRCLVEAASGELARRRAAEAALEGCNLGNVILVCTEHLTYLKAYNPRRKAWARLPMTEVEG